LRSHGVSAPGYQFQEPTAHQGVTPASLSVQYTAITMAVYVAIHRRARNDRDRSCGWCFRFTGFSGWRFFLRQRRPTGPPPFPVPGTSRRPGPAVFRPGRSQKARSRTEVRVCHRHISKHNLSTVYNKPLRPLTCGNTQAKRQLPALSRELGNSDKFFPDAPGYPRAARQLVWQRHGWQGQSPKYAR
jgi:hypothetical protein